MDQKVFNARVRKPFSSHWWKAWGVACAFLFLAATAVAQNHPVSPSLPTKPSGVPANAREDYDIPSDDFSEEARRLRALNVARQQVIRSDVKKILKLTTDLNAEIAASKTDGLTESELRKLSEIEKRARDIKQKMSVMMNPGLQPSDVRP